MWAGTERLGAGKDWGENARCRNKRLRQDQHFVGRHICSIFLIFAAREYIIDKVLRSTPLIIYRWSVVPVFLPVIIVFARFSAKFF